VLDYLATLGQPYLRITYPGCTPWFTQVYERYRPTQIILTGGEPAHCAFKACAPRAMGLILDIVPIHMRQSPDPWWQEFLEWGAAALCRFLRYSLEIAPNPFTARACCLPILAMINRPSSMQPISS